MTLQEMIARQEAILNAARAAGRELTDAERREFDSLTRQIAELQSCTGARAEGDDGDDENNGDDDEGDDGDDDAQRAIASERRRIRAIEDMCGSFGMDAREFVDAGTSLDRARAIVMERLIQENSPVSARAVVTDDEGDKFRRAAEDGLAMRAGLNVENPSDGSRELRGFSLRDIAIECLSRQEGKSHGTYMRMSHDELYGKLCRDFYNPSALFPAILDATINKSIVDAYTITPTTFELFTTKGSLQDFKESADHEYIMGGTGDFLEVPEGGALKADLPQTELLPTRKLKTYGRQFSMTRQAFINDDIGFLTRVPGLYAQAAKRTIDRQVYDILFDNPAIFDGSQLFSAAHGNVETTGTKPTQAAIQKMMLMMQRQTDPFGNAIYVAPKAIIVPVGWGFDLDVIFHSAQVVGSNNNDYNPLYNRNMMIAESPVLNQKAGENACPWFMAAEPTTAKGIQVDYLNGQETPTVRKMESPGVLGFTWDIFLDWGIAVRDFRGIAKNAGAVVE